MKVLLEKFAKYDKRRVVGVAQNISWIFLDKVFRLVTSLLVGVWIARYLGPERYGILNYVVVFPLIISPLAGLGLSSNLFNELVIEEEPKKTRHIMFNAILLKSLAGILSFLLIILANVYVNNEHELQVLIFISSLSLIGQSFDVVDIYFQSKRKAQYSVIPKLVIFAVCTCLRLYCLYNKFGLIQLVAVTSIEIIISGLVSLLLYIKVSDFSLSDAKVDSHTCKWFLKNSWPIMVSEMFMFLYVRVDSIMLKEFSNNIELGNYSVTTRITDICYFIPVAITTGLMPSIMNVRKVNYEEYVKRYTYLLNTLVVISVLLAIFITLTSHNIIEILYGQSYSGVARILNLNIWATIFVFLAIGSDRWLLLENLQKFMLYKTILGAIVNVAMNILLIPVYGAVGASLATLTAQFIASFILNLFNKKAKELFKLQINALFFLPRYLTKIFIKS